MTAYVRVPRQLLRDLKRLAALERAMKERAKYGDFIKLEKRAAEIEKE